jgi:hypothetical protein
VKKAPGFGTCFAMVASPTEKSSSTTAEMANIAG